MAKRRRSHRAAGRSAVAIDVRQTPSSLKSRMNEEERRVPAWMKTILHFLQKISNDGVPQFGGMLAYNLLLSIVPLLVGVLGLIGFFYFITGHTSADLQAAIASRISTTLPGGISGSIASAVRDSAGAVGIIGLATGLIAGASFFQSLDYALSVIFRLKQRDFVHEWLMSLGMVLLMIPLVLIIVLATSIPQFIAAQSNQAASHTAAAPIASLFGGVLSFLGGTLAAGILFGAMYVVVPNQRVPWKDVWRGALSAAALIEAYVLLFPFYASHFLHPTGYGADLGFAILAIVFFYYFSVIFLLGAELNSWLLGDRKLKGNLPQILHDLQPSAPT